MQTEIVFPSLDLDGACQLTCLQIGTAWCDMEGQFTHFLP